MKKDILNVNEYIIFGTGIDGANVFYWLKKHDKKCIYFLNNNRKIDEFCSCPVKSLNEIDDIEYPIIIATKEYAYQLIRTQLNERGMVEFDDYIFHEFINKKMVYLHGNCHMAIIKEALLSSYCFNCDYYIYPGHWVCEMPNNRIPTNICKNIDVWIHENIRNNNMFGYGVSDEWVRNNIGFNSIDICIPNLFGLGYGFFPQTISGNNYNKPISNGNDKNGIFPHGDSVIDECIKKQMKIDDVVRFCNSESPFDKEKIISNFELYMEKIKNREKDCNIKIYDYIKDNYKKRKIFYDVGHPSTELLLEISGEILKLLGITDKCTAKGQLDDHETPIYPCVISALGLKYGNNELRKSDTGKKLSQKMNFEEYIKEYIYWCYDII